MRSKSLYIALLCHVWPVWLYHIFPHYLINGTIFRGWITENKMCVWIFITTSAWNIYDSMKNSLRYYHKCMYIFMQSTCHSCQILIKLVFSKHIFEKSSNIKFHENMSSVSLFVPYWQTDKMKLTVACCNFANMPKESWMPLCLTFLEQMLKIIHSENI
jgi:hypothetical protein